MRRITVVGRHPSIIATAAALALRCFPLFAAVSFGVVGPVLSQERDPLRLGDVPQAVLEPRRDMLILRSGGYEEGELTGCSSESCSLAGQSHRRDDIVLIGLGITSSDPAPMIDDPMQDSIHLRGAAVLKARLLGINAQTVVSGQGANPRRDVAWIYLAPPLPAPPDYAERPIDPAEPEAEPESDVDPPPPPAHPNETGQPTPPPGPGYRSAAEAPASAEPHSYVWEGRIEVDNVFEGRTIAVDVHGRHKWRGVYQVKFLEKWIRNAGSVTGLLGQSFRLNEIVPLEMNYAIQADHHHDYDNRWGDVVLRGAAAGTLTGDTLMDAFVGSMLRFEAPYSPSESASPAPPRSFASWQEFQDWLWRFHTDRRQGCYELHIGFGGQGQPANELRALYHGIDRSGSSPIHPDPDADFLRVLPSHMPDGTNVYDCLEEPEQREVEGEFTYPFPDPGPLDNAQQITIKWSFTRCPEGVTCASPRVSEPAPQPDLCPRPTPQQALLDTGLRQQQLLVDRLAGQIEAYNRLADQARQWQGDFDHATRDCGLWQAARVLTNFLVGNATPANPLTAGRLLGGGGGAAGPMGQAGKELSNFLSMLEKVAAGDASWLLPNHEFNDWFSTEDAWEAWQFGYGQLRPDSDPERLLAGLRSCGAPTIGPVMDGATTYLRLLQRIEPMMRDAQKTLNDLRQQDLKLLDLWNKYHQACLDHAECAGIDPANC